MTPDGARALTDTLALTHRLRQEALAYAELLALALTMVAERDREIARLRERYHALLDERRATRGRTAA